MIDWSKPIQTRDGKSARVLGRLKGTAERPVIVAIENEKGSERHACVNEAGDINLSSIVTEPWDIINVPEPKKFRNIYFDRCERGELFWGQELFKSREEAELWKSEKNYITTVEWKGEWQ